MDVVALPLLASERQPAALLFAQGFEQGHCLGVDGLQEHGWGALSRFVTAGAIAALAALATSSAATTRTAAVMQHRPDRIHLLIQAGQFARAP